VMAFENVTTATRMTVFANLRRSLPVDATLAAWRAPDGWPLRRVDWPAERSRGRLLFQCGRGDFIEKYLEPVIDWQDRGWNVAGFDWRGQGGSGRLLADVTRERVASLDPLVDDLAAFVTRWKKASPAPHVLVGHSMGGHIVLRALAEGRIAVDAAVLVAPMIGINTSPLPAWMVRGIARTACAIGLGDRRVRKRRGAAPSVPGRPWALTRCPDRASDSGWWKVQHPELGLGPPSWSWVSAAYASMAALRRPGMLEKVATPLLVIGAEHDRLVADSAIRDAAARLPDAELRMFADSGHELLREAEPVRRAAMATIDRFLDDRVPRR
jgi:lysophospholipase